MSHKAFRLRADGFRLIAPNRGYCYATDMITVDGHRVGYMYREPPNEAADSGWRSFAGIESDEYANDPNNLELYDVNTIANYDSDIVCWLDTPYPVALERDSTGKFGKVGTPDIRTTDVG